MKSQRPTGWQTTLMDASWLLPILVSPHPAPLLSPACAHHISLTAPYHLSSSLHLANRSAILPRPSAPLDLPIINLPGSYAPCHAISSIPSCFHISIVRLSDVPPLRSTYPWPLYPDSRVHSFRM